MTFLIVCATLVYLGVAALLTRWNTTILRRHRSSLWYRFVSLLFMPAFISLLMIASVLSIPYFWLYPERHAHFVDFEGTDEQKAVLAEYRGKLVHKSFWRRMAEKLHLARNHGPKRPSFDV